MFQWIQTAGAWLGAVLMAPAATTPTSVAQPVAATVEVTSPTRTTTLGASVEPATLKLLRALEAHYSDIDTIHATFDQVRVDDVFLDETRSTGELWYNKPYDFRSDYDDPEPTSLLIQEEAFYLYVPELEQVEYWTFDSAAARDQQLHQLLIGFGFDTEELVRYYQISSSEADPALAERLEEAGFEPATHALLVFEPRPAYEQNASFEQMELYIDKVSLLPEKIWYRDVNDASMTLTMNSVETGIELSPSLFNRKAIFPSDVEYINKRNTP